MRRPWARDQITPYVRMISDGLSAASIRHQICGSYRRGLRVVRDLDILVYWPITRTIDVIVETAQSDGCAVSIHNRGRAQAGLSVDGVWVDLLEGTDESWGAYALYHTGAKGWVVALRWRARRLGLVLRHDGLYHAGDRIAGMTEENILRSLLVAYTPPAERDWQRLLYQYTEGVRDELREGPGPRYTARGVRSSG